MYGEPTKNVMNKKQVGERLAKEFFASIPSLAVTTVLIGIIFALSLASEFIPCIIIFGLALIIMLISVVEFLIKLINVKNGKFDIVKDRLMRIAIESERYGIKLHQQREVTVFYFFGGGRYVIRIGDGSVKDYSSIDDDFYLVCLGKKQKVYAIYNCKIYDIK